jgi:hypothetical protein
MTNRYPDLLSTDGMFFGQQQMRIGKMMITANAAAAKMQAMTIRRICHHVRYRSSAGVKNITSSSNIVVCV